ncbi:MAG: exodeoxyribonuclease VII small subunit [Phycisphaerae bacterium]
MIKRDDKPLNFEESIAQLERIVEQIASGKVGLEESLVLYEKGMELVQRCRAILDGAEKRIEVLSAAGGTLKAAPLETSLTEETTESKNA